MVCSRVAIFAHYESGQKSALYLFVASTAFPPALPHPNATTRWTILTCARYYGDALCSKLSLMSVATTTHTVFLQCPQRLTEDRPLVEDWKLSNEKWKFIGVFDGAITHVRIRVRC